MVRCFSHSYWVTPTVWKEAIVSCFLHVSKLRLRVGDRAQTWTPVWAWEPQVYAFSCWAVFAFLHLPGKMLSMFLWKYEWGILKSAFYNRDFHVWTNEDNLHFYTAIPCWEKSATLEIFIHVIISNKNDAVNLANICIVLWQFLDNFHIFVTLKTLIGYLGIDTVAFIIITSPLL